MYSPPEKSVIVTIEEKRAFIEVCQQIEKLVSRKIENFRTCFPFGCPKDDLKVAIKLFNLVRQPHGTSHDVYTCNVFRQGRCTLYSVNSPPNPSGVRVFFVVLAAYVGFRDNMHVHAPVYIIPIPYAPIH